MLSSSMNQVQIYLSIGEYGLKNAVDQIKVLQSQLRIVESENGELSLKINDLDALVHFKEFMPGSGSGRREYVIS